MKKRHTLVFLLLFVLLFAGCEKAAPQLDPPTDPTTSAAVTTVPTTTEPTTAEDSHVSSGDGATESGEWAFHDGYSIHLPEGVSLDYSILYDTKRPHEADNSDLNIVAGAPRKIGQAGGAFELESGETLKGIADKFAELDEDDEYAEEKWELCDSGEFTGQRGNRICYVVIDSFWINPFLYHFWIELDETHAAHIWFWALEYNPETDLPRLKEIAASVRP